VRTRTLTATLALAAATWLGIAQPASAHPLGNFTVNRAIAIEIGASVTVRAVLDLAEIPAYEAIREIDTDGDDAVSDAEGSPYADATCAAWGSAIEVSIDRGPVALTRAAPPSLTFPDGAGGLPTLRLECRFELPVPGDMNRHSLELRDTTLDERIGWREVSAAAAPGAVIEGSSVPAESETDLLTTYPEASLASPPDVRSASLTFSLGRGAGSADTPPGGAVGARDTADDPLAGLIGGQLSPPLVVLAILMSIGLGAVHALSPGHGKTLVAAYVVGAGGSARSAVQIGLWVAISHTAGVFVLGLVTLVASRYLLPERLIAWLSLGSGVVVTGLGIFLLVGVMRRIRRAGAASAGHRHPHDHDHDHDNDHTHPHTHPDPAGGRLSWRAAIALGFAGGAVPSASALIVFLVALATDRLALGMLLIVCFGLGMAGVLGGLAFAVARLRAIASDPSRWPMRPLTQRLAALAPAAAGLVVLATGIAFTVAAASRLA
jgi:ABC-type nickel/cobalt efflux system permease component RcnA